MDKPSFKSWLDRVASEAGRIGQDMGQAVRDAVESPTGQQVKRKLDELGPQVRKAVDDLRPEVERVYGQVAPEVKRVASDVARGTSRTLGELFGRPGAPHVDDRDDDRRADDVPPNVSPDASRREPRSVRFDASGVPGARAKPGVTAKKKAKKTTTQNKSGAKPRTTKPKA